MRFLTSLLILIIALGFPHIAHAQSEISVCPKASGNLNFNILCSLDPANAFPTVLSFILIIAIVIALFYLVWGGIKWIMSGGDKANVETARGQIIAAIIGLVLVFSAWFVLNFILQTFFGGNLTSGIRIPGIFSPASPAPTAAPATPSATIAPASSLPPCPTAYPPNFECQLLSQ